MNKFVSGMSAVTALLLMAAPSGTAIAKERCVEPGYERVSDVARAGVKKVPVPPVPGARYAVGKVYDVSQCVSVKGGKKIRDWAAEKRQQYEDRKK